MAERVVKHCRAGGEQIKRGRSTVVLSVGAQPAGGKVIESDEDCRHESDDTRICESDPQITEISQV